MFVPKFKSYYKDIELPTPTRILMGLSDVLVLGWPWVIAGLIAAVIGVTFALRTASVQNMVARWQLRVPIVGPIVQGLAVARFSRMLGTLLGNGISMLAAMRISRDAAGHPLMVHAIDRATEAVKSGGLLSVPLGESGLFDEDTVEMIGVGESANNLSAVLLNVAESIERRVDRQLVVLIRLMEPLLLLLLAGMVMFIFVALIVPMMRLSSIA